MFLILIVNFELLFESGCSSIPKVGDHHGEAYFICGCTKHFRWHFIRSCCQIRQPRYSSVSSFYPWFWLVGFVVAVKLSYSAFLFIQRNTSSLVIFWSRIFSPFLCTTMVQKLSVSCLKPLLTSMPLHHRAGLRTHNILQVSNGGFWIHDPCRWRHF